MKSCALMSLFLFCTFLALIGLAVASHEASPVTQQQRAAELAYQQQRDALDVAERQRQAQQWADLTAAWLPVAKVAGGLLIAVTPMTAIALAALGWAVARRRAALVYPDARGLLPADYDRLRRGDYDGHVLTALVGHHAAQLEAARNPSPALPPNLRSYSPKYVTAAPRVIEGKAAPAITSEPAHLLTSFSAPTFAALLQANAIGQDDRLLLGYTPDAPVVGSWADLYSTAVAGLSGSGKTTTVRFLAAQSALSGARFVVIDPHGHAGDDSLAATLMPLAPTFVTDPATDPATMRAVIKRVTAELEDRIKTGRSGPPLLVCVDEFTSLMRGPVGDDLARLIEAVGQEGRKYGLFCLLSGQVWTSERSGGTELRDSLASAYVHRTKPSQARLLVPDVDKGVARLPVGHAYLNRTNSPDLLEVAVPLTRAADLDAVARRLPYIEPFTLPDERKTPRPSLVDLVCPPPTRPPLRVVRPGESSSSSSSSLDDENDGDGDENQPAEATTPTTTTAPRPVTLVAKARDMGIDLDADAWRVLGLLDEGKSYHKIGEMIAGRSGGTAYSKWRGQAERLHGLITNWPDGEKWSTAAEGEG